MTVFASNALCAQPCTPLPWSLDPLEALRRWPRDLPLLMLHSGRLHERWSRWTVLASPGGAWRFGIDGRSIWVGPDGPPTRWTDDPFADLSLATAGNDALWIGYLSYDLGRWIERLPSIAKADRDWPLAQFHRCDGWLVHDVLTGRWSAHGTWAQAGVPSLPDLPQGSGELEATTPRPELPRDEYERRIARVIEYIAAGDVFQVNLAQRLTCEVRGDARVLYDRLATASPAWYGAYLECAATPGEPRRTIASTSPELFLELAANGRVTTRPIKGTRPASDSAEALRQSAKDQAELNMIVDLLRNDLGRVATFGSVRVEEARAIESHPTVHHGVATVTAQLRPEATLADLLRATFPGGSITGAPKVRAMEIIDELEPVRRGPYCGAIGWTRGNDACLNMTIRTILLEQDAHFRGRADFSVGGGIVGDSTPAAEYQETLDKAAAMLAALRGEG